MRRTSTILDAGGRPYQRTITHEPRRAGGRHDIDVVRQRGTYGWSGYGYRAVGTAADEGRVYLNYSGDKHLDQHRKKLIAQSRDFQRNNGIYTGMIERAVAYIVSNGFGLRVKTSSRQADRRIESLWRQWWLRPEVRGLLTGPQVARMACRELLAVGDFGAVKTDKATIRLIEAEQIDHPKLTDGIDKNVYGTPTVYHVCPYSSGGRVDTNKHKAVAAADFLFVVDPKRPSQTRGIPVLVSTFPMLHRINDVCDSEAVSWQLLARYAVAVLREEGPTLAFDESAADTERAGADTAGDDTTTRVTELDYALIFHGQPGESVKGIERNIPGKDFPESIRMFLRLVGLPLGLPLEIILLDWTKSNYSQSRAVLEQAYETFQAYQDILEHQFFAPLLQWKLAAWAGDTKVGKRAGEELRTGLSRDDTPVIEWIRPTFPWLDQLKEAQAQAAKLDRTLTTHAHVCKSLKLDREDVLSTREREVAEAIEIADRLSKQFDRPIPWEPFAGLAVATAPAKPGPAPEPDTDTDQETDTDQDTDQETDGDDSDTDETKGDDEDE
ncbi:MAG TPA: phage portal protein [Thermoguttaceae bacterium]|nr:phage portal protein [Thermoguttaceae bacterium]